MGLLNTSVCAAIIGLALAGSANAQDARLHPQLGKKPPRETLNSDLLALPSKERAAWIHGAMAQTVQMLAEHDPKASKCVTEWYFENGNGAELVPSIIGKYREHPTTATIYSLARRICPSN